MAVAGAQLIRTLPRRMLATLVALAVLLAVVRGGTRFFYCPVTELAFDESPCAAPPPEDEAASDGRPAVRAPDCCEERWRATAPTAETPKVHHAIVPSAALVAVVPPPVFDVGAGHASAAYALAQAVRARPPPPSASERRATLMVFHL